MRKFVQSFVLAAQSAKKYYVHIDIFRYQDIYQQSATDAEPSQSHGQYLEGIGCCLGVDNVSLVAVLFGYSVVSVERIL